MGNHDFTNPQYLSSYKKRINTLFKTVTSCLIALSMVLYFICYAILSKDTNTDYSSFIFLLLPIFLASVLPDIFIYKNQIQNGNAFQISIDTGKEERSIRIDKWYRVRQRTFYIVTIIWCVFFLFASIARMSNDIKFCIINNIKNSSAIIAMSVLSSIAIIVACAMYLRYLSLWKKVLIWNYDEINLSIDEKKAILETERANYKEHKSQLAMEKRNQKELRKHETNNSVQPKKTVQQYYKKNPETMTKLTKINELKEFFESVIITLEEYEKARSYILCK